MQIAIVILNYQTWQATIDLVYSLQRQTLADQMSIIVVDNCSVNDSFEQLKPLEHQVPRTLILQTSSNQGYAQGNNYALNYLATHGCPTTDETSVVFPDYVVIMNNDVSLADDCLEQMVAKYPELDNAGIIAPVMIEAQGHRKAPFKVKTYIQDCLQQFFLLRYLGVGSHLKERDTTGHQAMKVDMVYGSLLFVRFDIFSRIGFFHPSTFLYLEERFLAYALTRYGYKNYLILDQTYHHNHSNTINASINKVEQFRIFNDSLMQYYTHCSSIGSVRKNILRLLMKYSLFEMQIITVIQKKCRTCF